MPNPVLLILSVFIVMIMSCKLPDQKEKTKPEIIDISVIEEISVINHDMDHTLIDIRQIDFDLSQPKEDVYILVN